MRAHFAGMVGIVSADAENPPDREAEIAAGDRQCDDRMRRKCIFHGYYTPRTRLVNSVQYFIVKLVMQC
ncbi:hypothetical protein D3C71_2168150 [compost metagenome]